MLKAKNFIISVLIILVATLLLATIPTEAEASIYDDTVRLHILANSDTKEDQELKLYVRDRLLEKYSIELSSYTDVNTAKKKLLHIIPKIEEDVGEWIKERGFDYSVKITLGEEWYETRDYSEHSLPRGYYCSLRVLLGNAEGKNWWCVMYPPLCLDVATEEASEGNAPTNLTKEETALISNGKYQIKFKLLEFLSELFK